MKFSLIIPVYNERQGISAVLDRLLSIDFNQEKEVIVIDDGSVDGTEKILENYKDKISIFRHERNKGYGAALKTGIQSAQGEFIIITDGDGTYPNEEIPKLIKDIDKYDMVVASRTGGKVKIPLVRLPAKWCLNKLANYLTKTKIPDLNSGLRVMRKEVLDSFIYLLPDGFSFTTTITLAMLTNHYRVKYIPINYHARKGKSKIKPIYDTLNFFQLIIRTVLYFDPLMVFLPVSILFVFISSLMLLYRFFVGRAFGATVIILFNSGIQMLALGMIADLIDKRLK